MTARIFTSEGVEEVSNHEFYTRAFGHPPRTPEQKAADWRAKCELYAAMILNGGEWAVPCPCLADARKLADEMRIIERRVA